MDNSQINTISLCSGVGMLDVGLAAGLEHLGISSRCILYAEREAYPCSVLEARIEEGSLGAAPIWCGSFTELDATRFRGVVDCIVAGFPCQDLSIAGGRAGLDGARSGLFFDIVKFATDCGARFLFLENVAAIASATASAMDEAEGEIEERAAARVMGELADCGWNAEWITISAADVGANHGRARWFCLAWRVADPSSRGREERSRFDGAKEAMVGAPEVQFGISNQCIPVGNTRLQHVELQQREIRPEYSPASGVMAYTRHQPGRQNEHQRRRESSTSPDDCLCCEGLGIAKGNGRSAQPLPLRGKAQCARAFAAIGVMGNPASEGCQKRGRGKQWQLSAQVRCWLDYRSKFPMFKLANASSARWQGREFTWARVIGQSRQQAYGSVGQLRSLFAPSPSDQSWFDIIAVEPWLAPALSIEEQHEAAEIAGAAAEPVFCGMVDGLAAGLDFTNRARKLRCVGNGVVPLQAATAFVLLALRSGIF